MTSFSAEDCLSSTHMEEAEIISQQKKVENSEQVGVCPEISTVRSQDTESSSRYMVFTYFKGDISSKVDEHFSRALKRPSSPIDISSRRKVENIEPKPDGKQSAHQWSPRAQIWSSPYQGPSLPAAPINAAGIPMSVAQYRPDSHQNLRLQPHEPWLLPTVSSQSLDVSIYHQPVPELHRMMPATINNRQYSSLLAPLRGERPAAELSQQQTVPKTNTTSSWAGPGPGLTEVRQSVNPDLGFQHQQRRKDIYWY